MTLVDRADVEEAIAALAAAGNETITSRGVARELEVDADHRVLSSIGGHCADLTRAGVLEKRSTKRAKGGTRWAIVDVDALEDAPEAVADGGRTRSDILGDALDIWGEDLQIDIAIEEHAELITELARVQRGTGNHADLVEEIADAQVMLDQMKLIAGEEDVEAAVASAYMDLAKRIATADITETDGGMQQTRQRRQIEQLQQQRAADQARQQRQSLALEHGDEAKHGQRVWIIPEFEPASDERDYIVDSARDALPEYHCQLAVDTTEPMTEERIMSLLAGDDQDEDDHEPVADGGHVKLGTVTGGSILDADGEAILALQGTDGVASVRVPEDMVAPVNGLVEEVARHYNLDIPEVMPDGGTVDGAVDHSFDEAERPTREVLQEEVADVRTAPLPGSVALDLVTRQLLLVRRESYPDLAAHYEDEGYSLLSYGVHPYLPVSVDDAVFECVYLSDVTAESLAGFADAKTYDFPAGRLAHVPVEEAWGDA